MIRKSTPSRIAALAVATGPLVTTATCDPATGTFAFFRDDDLVYYDDRYYYDEIIIYEDCFHFLCF